MNQDVTAARPVAELRKAAEPEVLLPERIHAEREEHQGCCCSCDCSSDGDDD